jgi:hypothetical protein
MKKKELMKYDTVGYRIFVWSIIACVVIVTILGLWLAGSPTQERARRTDAVRVSDLQSISNAVDQYYNTNQALPQDLSTLINARETYWVGSIMDPETNAPYEYHVQSNMSYELCAEFTTVSSDSERPRITEPVPPFPSPEYRFWGHDAKNTCFLLTAQTFPKL